MTTKYRSLGLRMSLAQHQIGLIVLLFGFHPLAHTQSNTEASSGKAQDATQSNAPPVTSASPAEDTPATPQTSNQEQDRTDSDSDSSPLPQVKKPLNSGLMDPRRVKSLSLGSFELSSRLAMRLVSESLSPMPAAADQFSPGALTFYGAGRAFIGGRASFGSGIHLGSAFEMDLVSGHVGQLRNLEGSGQPNSSPADWRVRQANMTIGYHNFAHLSVGITSPHFGLGLVSHGGDHGWTAGSAQFSNPMEGDRNLGIRIASGPWTSAKVTAVAGVSMGGATPDGIDLLSQTIPTIATDDVMRDSDRVIQGAFALTFRQDGAHHGGVYTAVRHQQSDTGRGFTVGIADGYLSTTHELWSDQLILKLALETVGVLGRTSLGPSPSFPEKLVLQGAAAFQGVLDAKWMGGALDMTLASGDSDPYDNIASAFKTDPNYQQGFLLFHQVLAVQTAYATHTASDPNLTGTPAPDLDRYPTRGSISNAFALFPRLFLRPHDEIEVYSGPLVAFALAPHADPLQTKYAGGALTNAMGGSGRYLGTELDVGARSQIRLMGILTHLGAELGYLIPGDALSPPNEPGLPVYGGRVFLHLEY